MKNCPTCMIPVDGMYCPKCGYSESTEGPNNATRPEWLDPRWKSVAEMVAATKKQYLDNAPRSAGATPQDCVAAARALAYKLTHGDPDPKAWARRILERDASGERLPIVAIENAKEALRITLSPRPPNDGELIE